MIILTFLIPSSEQRRDHRRWAWRASEDGTKGVALYTFLNDLSFIIHTETG